MKSIIGGKKRCATCSLYIIIGNFYKDANQTDLLTCSCKECIKKKDTDIKRTKIGLLDKMYRAQVTRTNLRGYPAIGYSLNEFISYSVKDENFNRLYLYWVNSNYSKDLIPSADRLDDYKGYSFSNIRFVSWKENNNKGRSSPKHLRGVKGTNTKTKKTIEFPSIQAAQLTFNTSNISACCKGARKSVKGYTWEYIKN